MNILLLGAGAVGTSLAESLASEQNDIVVIDTNATNLRNLADRLDIATICGHASHPEVLRKAGAEDTDMIIAVTDNDEINMLACQIAYSLFKIRKRICRVRSEAYLAKKDELFTKENIPVTVPISPEKLITQYIVRLLEHPGSLQVVDFADDKARLVGVKAFYGGPIVGQALNQIPKHMPNLDTRVAAIYRNNESIRPEGDTVVEVDDEVFFIAATEHISDMMVELRGHDKPYQRIMIAGSGNIGLRLARTIENDFQVKIVDNNIERCAQLSDFLHRTIVIHGNASDEKLLVEENIDTCDVYCALTDSDEANIMSSLLAKKLGVAKVITLITNMAYVDLVQTAGIDIAISPQQITTASLLTHVRKGEVSNVYSLRKAAAEAIELTAKGDSKTSKVVGKTLDEIPWPKDVTVGAIIRGDEVIIAHGHVEIESEDHVILFLVDKKHIREVEKLFQVGFGFI